MLQLLRDRRAEGSRPGRRTDGHRLALAVEGGGMRGSISAAMLGALEDHGFRDAFDVVYGTSSGAVNSAYFLAGTTWYPLSIYYDDLTSRQFLDLRRLLRRRPLMDIDYAYEDVVRTIKPLDHQAVLDSPIDLVIAVTDVEDRKTLAAREFTSTQDLHEALRASAWLPIALHGTGTFRGRRALDGGVLTAHPRTLALQDGATHVLSLSTIPLDVARGALGPGTHLVCRYLDRIAEGLGEGYRESLRTLATEQSGLARQRVSPGARPPFVLDVAPLPGTPELKRHEMRPWRIVAACRTSYALAHCLLQGIPEDDLRNGRISAVPRLTIVERPRDERG